MHTFIQIASKTLKLSEDESKILKGSVIINVILKKSIINKIFKIIYNVNGKATLTEREKNKFTMQLTLRKESKKLLMNLTLSHKSRLITEIICL